MDKPLLQELPEKIQKTGKNPLATFKRFVLKTTCLLHAGWQSLQALRYF